MAIRDFFLERGYARFERGADKGWLLFVDDAKNCVCDQVFVTDDEVEAHRDHLGVLLDVKEQAARVSIAQFVAEAAR